MKNFPRALLLTVSLLPLLSHCASYDEVERLQNQLRTVNRRMEDMKSNQVDALQREQASSNEQVTQLQQRVQHLQGQLDDANQTNSRLREQSKSQLGKHDEALNKLEESLRAKDEKITALEERLKAQQVNIKLMQSKKVGDTEKALKEAQAKADAARAKAKTLSTSAPSGGEVKKITGSQTKIIKKTPAAGDKAQPDTMDEEKVSVVHPPAHAVPEPGTTAAPVAAANDKLAEGKQLYAQKQYAKAQAAFEEYLAGKPSASQAAEADYMIGECNFQNKQYNLAIISYQKVASKPTLGKAAAATLKQGMAFEQMADVEMAKIIYKKLIDQHPGTPEAKTAQERLGKL
jgi:TolA-binding protein